MCDCNTEKSLILINIYTEMAEYKANSKAPKGLVLAGKDAKSLGKEFVDFRGEMSQAQLAYAYEELNMTDFIDKTDKVNEKATTKKSTSKKATTTITENSEEE
jgi:hypothetical protein